MLPGLAEKIEELKQRRREIGMTQTELAEIAGVSQSFIAKLEAGSVSPSYERIRRIESALEDVPEREADAYITPAVTVSSERIVRDCVDSVLEAGYAIVIGEGEQRGSLTPSTLVSLDTGEFSHPAGDVMEDGFPEIPPHTPRDAIRSLLAVSPVVVVSSSDGIEGAITREAFVREELEF